MAAEMLEKILDAEKTAKEQLSQCQAKADGIIEKATEEGKMIINQAKLDAENESKMKIGKALEDSKILLNEMLAKAEKVCEELAENCRSKADNCIQLVADKLFS